MTSDQKPSYEELEIRLAEAEKTLQALRQGRVDTVVGEDSVYFLRLKDIELALRESGKRFRMMADGTPFIIWVTDSRGKLEFVNHAYCDFFGFTMDEILGTNWEPLVHAEDRASYVDLFNKALHDQKPFYAQTRVKRSDGQWRWIESYGTPLFSDAGEFIGMVGSSPDITDRKAMEGEWLATKETLEKRIRERTAELEKRAEQLSRLTSKLTLAEQQERRRIAELLHDHLQQLMVGAKVEQELLIDDIDGSLKPAAEKVLELIKQSIHITLSLTKELSPPAVRSGDLADSLEWLADWFKETHGLAVKIKAEYKPILDRKDMIVLLFQSVRELLFNTVKHAGVKSAEVAVSCDDNKLRITVSDEGCGVDLKKTEKQAMEAGGFGLFSIRERLLLMGGTCEADSAVGRGASFSLIVPLKLIGEAAETKNQS